MSSSEQENEYDDDDDEELSQHSQSQQSQQSELSQHEQRLHLKIGDRVETGDNLRGTVKYIGNISILGNGIFVGIELDESISSGNDGSIYNDKQYFECDEGYGIFIVIEECKKLQNIENGYKNGYNSHHDNLINMDLMQNMQHGVINNDELNTDKASKTLKRKFQRRPSQLDIEKQGIVPPNYFNDPIATTAEINFGHEVIANTLDDFLGTRPTKKDLENKHIVPHNYFEDPIASTKGKSLVKQMISSNLDEFHAKRPSLNDLAMKNIIPTEFINNDNYYNDHNNAKNIKQQKNKEIQNKLNEKLEKGRRPTITDLGDMHIIPHDYLDNLLEDAVANHTRKESRMDHVQNRLQKHLPQPVAQTLAETLVTSVQDDDDEDDDDNIHDDDDDEDDEWQISFVYEPMQSFVPMNPAQKNEVTNKLERRLSLRPSKQQIEVWGFVPPQYFESPEQSFLRQALGREIALDLLEGFFPNREDVFELTNRGIMHPDFVTQDHEVAVKQQHERKKSIADELNSKLDPKRRPSISDLGNQGLIPDNWLLDLYGLADQVRKKHTRMESAVTDLKSQLNVPPVLADVVARDVLDEIETVDPYLNQNENIINHHIHQQQQHQQHQQENQEKLINDNDNLRKEIQELRNEINEQKNTISMLEKSNCELSDTISSIKDNENEHLNKISRLETEISLSKDQKNEIYKLRQQQQSTELQRLDSKAIEIELSSERSKTQKLRETNNGLEEELFKYKYRIEKLQETIEQYTNDKIKLITQTNEQINKLRSYILHYQQYYHQNEKNKQKKKQKEKQLNQRNLFNLFG